MKYVTKTGQKIELATRRLGRGGEGQVLPVVGRPELVAKIFHKPTLEQRAKLEFMVANPVPQNRNHFWVTWPLDIVFSLDSKPKFVGYIMYRLANAQPLFICYNSTIRRQKLPDFNYHHLIRCARNLAAAFSLAHAHGHLIGDPNESNGHVSADARVTLIDADSWQLVDGVQRRIYRSTVAKSEFLPPELQNRKRKNIDRQTWHDNFALAVLLFKLLGEGCHPCDGVYLGAGDVPPLEERIAAGAFPFLNKSVHWRPKGLALPFNSLHPRLQKLFLQAFETGQGFPQARPDARCWQEAIATAERELHGCQRNSRHSFWGNQCVWCHRKKLLGGRDPFPGARPKLCKRVTTVARTVSCPAPIRYTAPKIMSAPTSPPNANLGISDFDRFTIIILMVTAIITLAILGLKLIAKVMMLVAQKLN
jgi:DNA-binding helix-hairpin-helix protein with protein kinase domain